MAGRNSDKRIMQMEFDNKQFELNIKKSQKSVEDLKKAMDFNETSKGLEKFSGVVDKMHISDAFDKLTGNIQKLTDKFTGLGTVSELVVSQIRRHIESVAARVSSFIDSMTTAQVSAGMDKYETLNKSVQTIKAATGKDEKEVYEVLQRLNDYTDQTSYNFSDMASNIGKFTSVGIDLKSAERQMEGIANWAARSGAGINEASRAMYNLSQAMGMGKLTKIDWKSIENAGMATKEFKEQLIDAAVLAGTLIEEIDKKTGKTIYKTASSLGKQVEVNYQNVADTLSKGWASSSVLSSTLERYYYDDLYYQNERTKATLNLSDAQKKAYNEMIESNGKLDKTEWKSLEKMGVLTDETKQKILNLAVVNGKLATEVKEDGTKIYKTVNKTGKQIEFTLENIEDSLQVGWYDKKFGTLSTSINDLARNAYESAQKCLTFTDVLNAWKDQISTGWMKTFTLIFGELSEAMDFFSKVCNRVGESLDSLISFRNDILEDWVGKGGRQSLIDMILGDYGKDVKTGAVGILDMFEKVGEMLFQGLADFFSVLEPDAAYSGLIRTNKQFFKAYLGKRLSEITTGIGNFMKGIRDFFNTPIKTSSGVTTRLEQIQNIIQGIAGVLAFAWIVMKEGINFINTVSSQLEPAVNDITTFLSDLGISIFNTTEEAQNGGKIRKFFTDLAEIVRPLSDSVNSLVRSLTEFLRVILGMEDGTGDFSGTLHTLGEVLKTVADIFVKIASPIINFVSKIIDAFSDLFRHGINGESMKQLGTDLGNAFGEMMTSFADELPEGMSFLSDWIHSIFGGGKKDLENESQNLFGLIGNVNKQAEKTKKNASQNEDRGGAGLLGLLTGTNVAVWVGVAALVAVTMLINKARKTVGKIGSFFSGLSSALRDGFKIKYEADDSATRFEKIAKGLALIAASIIVLGLIPLSALIQGGIAMVAIMGAMYGLMFLLKKSQKALSVKEQMALTAQIMAISASAAVLGIAVGILAAALVPFALMNWDSFGRAMAGLAGILIQLGLFMAAVKLFKLNRRDYLKLGGIVSFAFSIGLLARAILPFAGLSWDGYAKTMAGLGGVLLQMIACVEIMKLLKINNVKLIGFAGFAFSIGLIVLAIKPFAGMNWDQYGRAMAGLGGVLLEMIAAMEIMNLLKIKTRKLAGFIGFALSIGILVFAMRPFVNMNWDQFGRAMAGLGGVLLEMIAAMKLLDLLKIKTTKLAGFIGFALSIGILVFALQPFVGMTWEEYGRVMAGLGGVLLELIGTMWLMKLAKGTDDALPRLAGFILFALSLKILIDAIKIFAAMDLNQFYMVLGGLGGILLELVFLMGLLKLINTNNVQILGLAGFAGGLSMLINALKPFLELEKGDWESIWKALVALAGILTIISAFMVTMKFIQPNTKNMLQMAIFAGIFAAIVGSFAAAMILTKDVDWETIAAFAIGVAAVVGVLSLVAAVVGKIGAGSVMAGMAAMALGIAMILGVVIVMVPLLVKNLASGFSEAMGHLVLITDMIELFANKMSSVDQESLNRGISGVEQLKLLVESFAGFGVFTEGIESFRAQLFGLATVVESFDRHTSGISVPENNKGLAFLKSLADSADDLDIIAKMDLEKLRTNIAGLGGAMMIYAQGAKEAGVLESGETPDVTAAVNLLQEISKSLAAAGGFTIPENMPDDEVLGSFGTSLAALAGSFKIFEEAGEGLGTGYDKGKKALEFFRDLKADLEYYQFGENLEQVQKEFSKDGEIIKPDVLLTLGADIEALGSAMSQFAKSTTTVDEATGSVVPLDFTSALASLESFVSFQERLPVIGGFLSGFLFGDEMTLGDLSANVVLLGAGLNDFALAVSGKGGNVPEGATDYKGINEPAVKAAEDTINFMIRILTVLKDKMPNVGGLLNSVKTLVIGRDFDFSDLKAQIVQLAEGMGVLGEKLNNASWADNTGVTNAMASLDSILAMMIHLHDFISECDDITSESLTNGSAGIMLFRSMNDLVSMMTDDSWTDANEDTHYPLIDKLVDFMQALDESMGVWFETEADIKRIQTGMELFKTFSEGLKALVTGNSETLGHDWKFIGSRLTTEIASGIGEGVKDVVAAVQTLMSNVYTQGPVVEGVSWETLGHNIGLGVKAGVDFAGTEWVTPAVKQMMINAYNAGKAAIDSNSPSKLFMTLGAFTGEGMAIGIKNSEEAVSVNAGALGEVALEKARDMVAIISRVMAEDVDANPTISPVLDLTNLENGMNLFAKNAEGRAIGLTASLGTSLAGGLSTTASSYDFNQLKPDYTGIYTKMNELGEQINQLGSAISKIKIVLNSGVVAGGITDDVDANLGRKTFYAGRNN